MLACTTARKGVRLTTAIIGVGNLGSALARHLVAGDERVVLAAADDAHAKALADELGPNASAASVRRRHRWRRRRRARNLARPGQAAGARPNPPARGQGRRRSLQPDRLRRERADDPDAAGRTVVRLRGRQPPPRECPLRQGVRDSRRRPARDRKQTTSRESFSSTPPTTTLRRPPPNASSVQPASSR